MRTFPIDFDQTIKANFVERANRFLVRCHAGELGVIDAHLPNPGRLWELLLPGATLYLSHSDRIHPSPRKTDYSVLAVQGKECPIFLDTRITNHVARYLIERRLIPSLEGAEAIKEEVSQGKSRFDFLLQDSGKDLYLEVKSCTLVGNGVAMFPDAITERGKRHLLELAEMARNGTRAMILFVVHYPHVRWFMPDFHTDYVFSATMLKVRNDLRILPVAIRWNPDLTIGTGVKILDIPWEYLKQEIKDMGSYLLVLRLETDKPINIAGLGEVMFRKGYFIYVGSAMRNLGARIERHRRKRKKMHWHIDYLGHVAHGLLPILIRSSQRHECEIAQALASIMDHGPSGFGSSDCQCLSHLFWSERNPLHIEAFHDVLQSFRMRHP